MAPAVGLARQCARRAVTGGSRRCLCYIIARAGSLPASTLYADSTRGSPKIMSWFSHHAVLFALLCAGAAVIYGLGLTRWIISRPAGTERMQEIARASSRSRRSGASLPKASEASSEHVWRSSSETLALRSSSTSCSSENPASLGSASDSLTGPHLLREDLLHRRALLMARDLTLRRVPFRYRKPGRSAELLGDRLHPLDELLEARPCRNRLAAFEVDQLARQP